MHHHRIAAFLSGCLILGGLFMIFVATQNFQTVDRVLATPPQEAAQMFLTLGHDNSRLLLRYLAGEENRLFFVTWELAEIALGIALTAILLFALRSGLLAGLAGGMVIIALFQHFRVTPEMISAGRLIDFGAGAGSDGVQPVLAAARALWSPGCCEAGSGDRGRGLFVVQTGDGYVRTPRERSASSMIAIKSSRVRGCLEGASTSSATTGRPGSMRACDLTP